MILDKNSMWLFTKYGQKNSHEKVMNEKKMIALDNIFYCLGKIKKIILMASG